MVAPPCYEHLHCWVAYSPWSTGYTNRYSIFGDQFFRFHVEPRDLVVPYAVTESTTITDFGRPAEAREEAAGVAANGQPVGDGSRWVNGTLMEGSEGYGSHVNIS